MAATSRGSAISFHILPHPSRLRFSPPPFCTSASLTPLPRLTPVLLNLWILLDLSFRFSDYYEYLKEQSLFVVTDDECRTWAVWTCP